MQPVTLTQSNFEKWYDKARVFPLPVLANLNPRQVARFEEQSSTCPAWTLKCNRFVIIPDGTTAAHLLGYLSHDNESRRQVIIIFRKTDFAGAAGIEKLFDEDLHGTAGEELWSSITMVSDSPMTVVIPPVPGQNVVLTIDADVQKTADTGAAIQPGRLARRGDRYGCPQRRHSGHGLRPDLQSQSFCPAP